MLNAIRMDVYRMFKTKSLYVIWIILAAVTILTTGMASSEEKNMELKEANYQASQEMQEDAGSNSNVGMTMVVPTRPDEKITLFDMTFANIQGKVLALFIAIFAVIYSTADLNSGYMKHIGGQVSNRQVLILSKLVPLFLYTVMTFGLFLLSQMVSNRIFFGYLRLGDMTDFGIYLGTEVLLHFALALISMTLAVLLRNNVFSMMLVICMCMNVLIILYSALDKLVHKLGFEDFQMVTYTVTGKISALPMSLSGKELGAAVGTAVVFIIVMTGIAGVIFKKRDI